MTWRESAACAGEDPEMFFPGTGGNRHVDTYTEARKVCARCPVTLQCLEDALAHEEWGMRGGLTPDEQHQLRKDRQRVKADLGKATECVKCDRRLLPRPPSTKPRQRPPEGYHWRAGHGMCARCYALTRRPKPTGMRADVDEAAVAADYLAGMPTDTIRGRYKIGHPRLARILAAHGIPQRGRGNGRRGEEVA